MNWTKEQKRIIDLKNSNILVSAAAGREDCSNG